MSIPTYQELLDRSDLAVIGTPTTSTTDTNEQSFLPNIFSQDKDGKQSKVGAIGVETAFKICVVLKGEKPSQQIVLHHYRLASAEVLVNGPMLVSFELDPTRRRSYLLFLVRERDGRYAPTSGQTDPGFKGISAVPFELD
jgi:hypothetical protein